MEIQARVQSALDAVHGVDLNPFAVAVARFRLTVAALQACGLRSLEDAPAFKYHLAVGDSLIHGPDANVLPGMEERGAFMPFHYATEDSQSLLEILEERRYDAVVGNPPYITVRDSALNKIYRSKFGKVCKGTYALTVPFMVQFFALAKLGEQSGWVGMITSKSFMKREFGEPLIETYLPSLDLRLVVDSEGAWIPGHNTDGTPTVIIVGRRRFPSDSKVRCVLGKGLRETRAHGDEGRGPCWSSIVDHWNDSGFDNDWITVADVDRKILSIHPWSLTGGATGEIRAIIESATDKLRSRVIRIGFMAMSHADEAFMVDDSVVKRERLQGRNWPPTVSGDGVRDFTVKSDGDIYFPYRDDGIFEEINRSTYEWKWLWPMRTVLGNRATFTGGNYFSDDRPWSSWHQVPKDTGTSSTSIAYAEVASHNNFVLNRGSMIFRQTAPIIRFSAASSDSDICDLFGILNSSTACFWIKQQSQPKGGAADLSWLRTYQANGAMLHDCPLPTRFPSERSNVLDDLAQEITAWDPAAACASTTPSRETLETARERSEEARARMIAVQEELDWEVYKLYGLIDEDRTYNADDLPGLALGERAFEIALAKSGEETAWFERHGSQPITEIPAHWPAAYRELVEQRLELIAEHPYIRLLEKPEYKRRWSQEPWGKRQERALLVWLLDRLEDRRFWFDGAGGAEPKSVGQLADEVTRDVDVASVLALWAGRPDVPVTESLEKLLADEAIPFLAAYRYKDSGLRTRAAWEETWDLQRREDRGEKVGTIPVPPKYTSADFRRTSYWRARGKLDVPKERFILYPGANRLGDPTMLLGWAGWDHAEQSLALSRIIGEREQEGWDDERLVPLVAGLAELQPWVEQWHSDVDVRYGVSLAAFCREQLDQRAAQVGMTLAELAAWRPAPSGRGRKPRAKGGAE